MKNLKNNIFITLGISIFAACSTSRFVVIGDTDNAVEVAVTTERVLLECEYQKDYDGDIKNPYGF